MASDKRFPHLSKANGWPGLATVDPFDLQVTFDPWTWTPDVRIHLVNTRLDERYMNVIGWESREARDAWYDEHAEMTWQPETEFHILPGAEIKLPLAFEVLQHYNQLFIDFPPTATDGGSKEPTRFYYFISDVAYRSPSATACVITLDEWTTHSLDVDMPYIRLARGHAPMAAVTADAYLANPLAAGEFVTADSDDDFGRGGIGRIAYTVNDVINAGPMWCVIAMSSDPDQSPGTVGQAGWKLPTTQWWYTQGARGYSTVAIEPGDLSPWLDILQLQAPQILSSIVGVFLVPKRLVTIDRDISYLGITMHVIVPRQVIDDVITLDKTQFGYPDVYRDIAKLYSTPYAWLEVTDSEGTTQTIRVEDTSGRIQLSVMASIVYPMTGYDCYVIGIGGGADATLAWSNFTGHEFSARGDWTASLRHYSIPTYAVLQNPVIDFDYREYWSREQTRAAIAESYRQSTTSAATQKSVTDAGLDRTVARLGQKQAEQTEALTMSLAAQADVRDAQDLQQSVYFDKDRELQDVMFDAQQQQTYLSMSQAETRTEKAVLRDEIGLGIAGVGAAIATGQLIGVAGAAAAGASGGVAAAQAAGSAVIGSGALAGFGVAVTGVVHEGLQLDGTVLEGEQQQVSLEMVATNNQTIHSKSVVVANEKYAQMVLSRRSIRDAQDDLKTDGLALQQRYESAINAGDVATARAAAATSKNLADNLAGGTRTLNLAALDRSRAAAELSNPRQVAGISGTSRDVTMPTAISVRVRTEIPSAIASAGDMFLTYGYKFAGRQWTIGSLNVMPRFSYWQGDLQIGEGHVNGLTRGIIHDIFERGVMVWRDPDRIGTTSIHENAGR